MKKRNPIAVILFSIITLGIYAIVWFVKTKLEMNRQGAKIPTAWLIIIPIINIWWVWKYCEGVEEVTSSKMSAVTAMLMLVILGFIGLSVIGMAIIQDQFNKIGSVIDSPVTNPIPPANPPSDVTTEESSSNDNTPPTPPLVQ